MSLITINGQFGSSALELAQRIAHRLNFECLDEAILSRVADQIGASVAAISQKEARIGSLTDRIIYHVRTILERSAIVGAGGEPFFGSGIETILVERYTDLTDEPLNSPKQIHDQQFVDVAKSIITNAAERDDLVIVGRASNIILKGKPGAVHIGIVGSYESRLMNIMETRECDRDAAEKMTLESEKARLTFFKKYFGAYANDPMIYDCMVNMDKVSVKDVTDLIVNLVQVSHGTPRISNGV